MRSPPEGLGATESLPTDLLEGRYRVGARLGRGGMGTVYRAVDTRLDRPVAVKVLRDSEGVGSARFAAEVRTLARFVHPNLVRLLDAGEIDGRAYLVMDVVEGSTLAQRLSAGTLSSSEAATVGCGVAEALAYVHRFGVVHRDVKPANVLLDGSGEAHLADFGIARLVDTTGMTATGLTLGTPAYLAPEQVLGGEVGPAVDVYALGLVLLECLSGRRAFEGTASEITAARLQRDPGIPAELDAGWREILRAMTARAPADRPDAAAVAGALSDRHRLGERSPAVAISDQTVALGIAPTGPADAAETERIARTETVPVADVATVGGFPGPARRAGVVTASRVAAGLLGLAAIGLVLGLTLGGTGPRPTPVVGKPPVTSAVVAGRTNTTTTAISTTTTSTPPTTTPPTTTPTTMVSTTTTPPTPVETAAGALVSALNADVTQGTVASTAGVQLVNELQPLLAPGGLASADQQVSQFDQFVQLLEQVVANGQVAPGATVSTLTALTNDLGAALSTSVSSTTVAPPIAVGNGNGRGHGGGHGNGN